ncbi:MAG: hypothetical protein P1U67_01305 [Alcanivoracaceae bacterium]|nr:hypothetical protein [Alcanivoracaceae bacterium]
MNVAKKALYTVLLIGFLCFAISRTNNESWLGAWFSLLFFVAIPMGLLVIKDLLVLIAPSWLGSHQVLLHVCALFSAVVGYGLGDMAVSSGHESSELHRLFVVIFPLAVYMIPLMFILHGVPLARIKAFYFKPQKDDE